MTFFAEIKAIKKNSYLKRSSTLIKSTSPHNNAFVTGMQRSCSSLQQVFEDIFKKRTQQFGVGADKSCDANENKIQKQSSSKLGGRK